MNCFAEPILANNLYAPPTIGARAKYPVDKKSVKRKISHWIITLEELEKRYLTHFKFGELNGETLI